MVPAKPPLIRFSRIVRPTLPGFSVAPMTATDLGEKIGLNGRRLVWRRISWADSMELADLVTVLIFEYNLNSFTGDKMTVGNIADFPAFGKLSPYFAKLKSRTDLGDKSKISGEDSFRLTETDRKSVV